MGRGELRFQRTQMPLVFGKSTPLAMLELGFDEGQLVEKSMQWDGPSGHQKPSRERSARILPISAPRPVLLYPVRSLRRGRIRQACLQKRIANDFDNAISFRNAKSGL
jgi:hypothetical protein